MLRIKLLLFGLFIISVRKSSGAETKPNPTPYQDWDYLVFTQRWSISACLEWKEKSKDHQCNLPQNDTWLVHGIWPTKAGYHGPYFCNSAIHFDDGQIAPILDDLKAHWTNVESGTKNNSLWKHEWDKHGTCAATLPQLNSVTNFFQRGLLWNKQYDLYTILKNNKITPENHGYNVQDIYDTLKTVLQKNPTIECISVNKESLLSEIRICFDKALNLIDCTGNDAVSSGILGDCNLKKPVMYFAEVNTTNDDYYDVNDEDFVEEKCLSNLVYKETEMLINFYKFIKFLMWFTL